MLGNMIGGFIVIMVGTTLAPSVANSVYALSPTNSTGANTGSNITGASWTIINLTTLFYNLSIASSAIGIAAQGLKNAGLM